MKKKIRIIINPISGIGKQKKVEPLVKKLLDKEIFDYEIAYTQYAGHATLLAKEAAENSYYAVIAVGGDGSVNEVAKGLVHSNSCMGVIPAGSGNGMARFLHIPLNISKAIQLINQQKIATIDSALFDEHFFISTAGTGFDAIVAHQFAGRKKRGFFPYFYIILKTYLKYQPQEILIEYDGKSIIRKPFMLTFANAGQFGFNAEIAPDAKMDDAELNVCILRKIPILLSPFYVLKLFTKKFHTIKYIETIKAKKIQIACSETPKYHIDGDPLLIEKKSVQIQIVPHSLKIFIP